MRFSMTGATGFVGGVVARQLRNDGHDVVALVRDPERAARLRHLGVSIIPGDLDDPTALERICAGTDGLFHIAGWYKIGTRNPADGWRVNVEGTRNVLGAAKRAGVPRVVYTSTLAVNGDTHGAVVDETYRYTGKHLSVYDQTKARAHDVALEFAASGLPAVIVMPGLVYGPGDTALTGQLIRDVAAGRRVVVPAGGGVCWGHVDDIAAGHLLAMQRGVTGESYMLAGPRATLADGLRLVAALAGTKSPMVLPSPMVAVSEKVVGVVGRMIPLPPSYAAESLRAGLATYYGTSEKARSGLGWTSRDLDAGLRETIQAPTTS
jgi:nucleoside-diphosphate-sugar epimerase